MAEGSAQVKEEPAKRAGDTEQNPLPSRLLPRPASGFKCQISNSKRAGSSSASFIATSPSTASRPSMMRWSYDMAK